MERVKTADGRRQTAGRVIPCERLPSVVRSLPSGMPGLLNDNAPAKSWLGRCKRCRRRPTLPRSLNRSTIGAVGLNDRVRNGNECGPYALVASDSRVLKKLTAEMGSVRKDFRILEIVQLLCGVCIPAPEFSLCGTKNRGSSQAARAIRTAALGGNCSPSTGGLSTWWSPTAL